MGETSGNSSHKQIPHGMLQDRAMPHIEDVTDIGLIATRSRACERHIADAAGGLDEVLAGDLRVRLPRDAVIGQEAVDLSIVDGLTTDDVDRWLMNEFHIDSSPGFCSSMCCLAYTTAS